MVACASAEFDLRKALLQARVLLCHITRRVSEDRIMQMAGAVGLVPDGAVTLAAPEDALFRLLSFAWRDCTPCGQDAAITSS